MMMPWDGFVRVSLAALACAMSGAIIVLLFLAVAVVVSLIGK